MTLKSNVRRQDRDAKGHDIHVDLAVIMSLQVSRPVSEHYLVAAALRSWVETEKDQIVIGGPIEGTIVCSQYNDIQRCFVRSRQGAQGLVNSFGRVDSNCSHLEGPLIYRRLCPPAGYLALEDEQATRSAWGDNLR